jgi:hypothetical protein
MNADADLTSAINGLHDEYKTAMKLDEAAWNPENELGTNAMQNKKDYSIAFIESRDVSNHFDLSIEYRKQQIPVMAQTPQGPVQIAQEQVAWKILEQGWR